MDIEISIFLTPGIKRNDLNLVRVMGRQTASNNGTGEEKGRQAGNRNKAVRGWRSRRWGSYRKWGLQGLPGHPVHHAVPFTQLKFLVLPRIKKHHFPKGFPALLGHSQASVYPRDHLGNLSQIFWGKNAVMYIQYYWIKIWPFWFGQYFVTFELYFVTFELYIVKAV